jgi:transmembrane sensor
MNHGKRSKLNAQISEEAAEWLVELRTDDLDASGRQAFDAWVRTSPEHLRAFLEMAAIWNEGSALDAQRELDVDAFTDRVRAESNVVSLDLPSDEAMQNGVDAMRSAVVAQDDSALKSAVQAPHGASRRPARPYAIAASVVLFGVGLAIYAWDELYREPSYATAVGEQRTIALADGSTVQLNSHSRVRLRFTDVQRTVDLEEGQALFHVAKNAARPFIVRSEGARVRAVGTQFDVDRTPAATIVTVVEGRVAVSGNFHPPLDAISNDSFAGAGQVPSRPAPAAAPMADGVSPGILVGAGEQLTVSSEALVKPAPANVAAAIAWTHHQVILDAAPLRRVAEVFNRYSVRKLVVEDSSPSPLRLSGVFDTDPRFLIEYLRGRSDIQIVESPSEIRINRVIAR